MYHLRKLFPYLLFGGYHFRLNFFWPVDNAQHSEFIKPEDMSECKVLQDRQRMDRSAENMVASSIRYTADLVRRK
jgi:hypothetical protein